MTKARELADFVSAGNPLADGVISFSEIADGNAVFGDNSKAIFGAGSDLQIYHDGTASIIKDAGTGYLKIGLSDAGTAIQNTAGNNLLITTANDVSLNYAGATKLTTTATGIDVTGTVTADGLETVSGVNIDMDSVASGQLRLDGDGYGAAIALNAQGMNLYTNSSVRDVILGTNETQRLRVAGWGDITFYDTSGNPSFVYDESAGSTFNEQGDNKDFRVESDSNANMLFVDASANAVGIGTNSPQGLLDVGVSGATSNQFLTGGVGNNAVTGIFKIGSGVGRGASIQGFREASSNLHSLDFYTYNSGDVFAMRITSAGNVGIGASTVDQMLHVERESGTTLVKTEVAAGSVVGYEITKTGATNQNWRIADGIVENGQLEIYDVTGSRSILAAKTAEIVFNDTSTNTDFRVESDGNTHALFVDASTSRVGIKAGVAPACALHIGQDTSGAIKVDSDIITTTPVPAWVAARRVGEIFADSGGDGGMLRLSAGGGVSTGQKAGIDMSGYNTTDQGPVLRFYAGTLKALIRENQTVFNEDSQDQDFRVESDTQTHMLFVNAGDNAVLVGKGDATVATTGLNLSRTGCTYSHSTGNTYHVYDNGTGPSYVFYVSYGGAVSYISLNQLSDRREKENIVDIPVGLDAVKQLRPRQFDWIKENQDNNVYGFIAQEVEEVLPNLVNDYMKDEGVDRKGLKHIELIAVLTKAIQEQQTMIETLEARIAALETA